MFNLELYELLLKKKENDLTELKKNDPSNVKDADILNKEINYLKAAIARYKIAVLLKLDQDPDYLKINFFGIEEENVTQFNLTPEELAEYNKLIADIPAEQLQRNKIRRHMAEVLGESISEQYASQDYMGIENINPNLVKYGLTLDQIKDYADLVSQLNALPDDTTKNVNANEEAKKIVEDSFNNLNIESIDTYNKIKDSNLKTIDEYFGYVDDDSKKKLLSNVSNYEFALFLTQKYPDLNVILSINEVERLLGLLSSSSLDESKYNEYLKLICNSIKELYREESNKQDIENIINNMNQDNYELRSDLKSNLPAINNASFDIKDSELKDVFEYVDLNYNAMDQETRDKYYNLLKDKLNKDISDVNKIEEINKLFMSVSNLDFGNRLKGDLSSKGDTKFGDQHLSSYQTLVSEEIKKLEQKKAKYTNKNSKSGILSAHHQAKIRAIDMEIEELKNINADYENNKALNALDSVYDKGTDKVIEIKKEIEELKQLKSTVQSKFHQNIIDKQIANRNKRIATIQKGKNKIVGVQKKIMAPKLFIEQKKGMIERGFAARDEVFNQYADDYKSIADAQRNLGGMLSGVKAAFYDLQSGVYKTKAEFNQKMCDTLNKGVVRLKGSNRRRMNPNDLTQIRQQQQVQQQVQTI